MPTSRPRAPLPPPLVSSVPGTWAYDTMSRRVRTDILARVFRENCFPAESQRRLLELDAELADAGSVKLSRVRNDGGPDVDEWNGRILKEVIEKGETWLSAPWVVAEFYFYRRIMSAIDYFKEPMDPFQKEKELGLASAVSSLATLAAGANEAVLAAQQRSPTSEGTVTDLKGFLLTSLWGNKQDLSLWPVGRQSTSRAPDAMASLIEFGERMILANDVNDVAAHLVGFEQPARVDIIVDNAGFELFCDLCLADFLVSAGLTSVVHLQLKAHPTFVSDAMAKDVDYTLDFLRRDEDSALATLGNRWAAHVESGKWRLVENFFWVQPTAMWDMPAETCKDLSASALVIVKGDANYRRLLGERDWDFDTPFADVLSYFPAPVCALRTLKAEIGCGMPAEVVERAKKDSDWLVAGKYGVIQFLDTRKVSGKRVRE